MDPLLVGLTSNARRALRAAKASRAYSAGPALLQTPADPSSNLRQSPSSAGRGHAFSDPPLALTLAAAAWLFARGMVRPQVCLRGGLLPDRWRPRGRAWRTGRHSSGRAARVRDGLASNLCRPSQGRERLPTARTPGAFMQGWATVLGAGLSASSREARTGTLIAPSIPGGWFNGRAGPRWLHRAASVDLDQRQRVGAAAQCCAQSGDELWAGGGHDAGKGR